MESEALANLGMGKGQEVSESLSQAADRAREATEEIKAEEVKELDPDEIISELANELKNSYQNAIDWIVDENNTSIAIVALTGTLAAGVVGYWYLSLRQVNVNCWFCGEVSSIRASETNSWTCPECDQFNGFTSEGDIDERAERQKLGTNRFQERGSVFCTPVKAPMQFGAPQLCSRCSDLPEIKARRLREFVPTSEAFEDEEIAAFERQLERTCRPCIMCQMKIDQYLKSQQAGLSANISGNDSRYPTSRVGSHYARSRLSQAGTSIWRTPPRSVYNSIAASLMSKGPSQQSPQNSDQPQVNLTLFRRMRFLTILSFLSLGAFSIFGSTLTKYVGCFAFGLYLTFSTLVARHAPRISILLIYCVILRQFLPFLFTTNFEIPLSVKIALQIFNSLEQMKIILWKIELGVETVLIFYLFQKFAEQYDQIVATLLDSDEDASLSSEDSPRKPPTQIGARYSPKKRGLLDNSFEGMSIDEDDEGITPFDSVSNFGLPDQMGDAMEVSFGTPARKRDFLNTSFQSDVKSVISTAAKTTVKVASNVWRWLFPLLSVIYLVIFYKIVHKVQNYTPDKNRLTL